jgi:DNA-binding NarL/FixJ family response regulator
MMTMTADHLKGRVSALVVGRPGPLQDSLAALLATIPALETVTLSGDISATLENVCAWNPDIVLLDSSTPGCTLSKVLDLVRQERPQMRWIVLADNVQQQQDAQADGADAALLKGAPAAELVMMIERLLSYA